MRSADEAVSYLKTLHGLIRNIEISDANMQEGSFRCDVNISVRKLGDKLGIRTELKNLNSFKFIDKAIKYEVARQIDIIENGGTIKQETRSYDVIKNKTLPLRSKEDAHDYRYFPDPDLLPVVIEQSFIDEVKSQLPATKEQKTQELVDIYSLKQTDAELISSNKLMSKYFIELAENVNNKKLASNWLITSLAHETSIGPQSLAELINEIDNGMVSASAAKKVFAAMQEQNKSAKELIKELGLAQISDMSELDSIISEVIKSNPEQIEQYKSGKTKVFGFLVGQVMQKSKGKANPKQVSDILKKELIK
jgi:aspartyl-tRNA(Asn)/glutamyl-tRNA(Gln) amidotransferase subunit B